MNDKFLIPFLAIIAVLLFLCCTVFGLHNVKAETSQVTATTAAETSGAGNTLKTVRLDVPGMTCASCPFIIKKTLKSVEGVSAAEASFETMSTTVTFDESKTNIDALLQALKNRGYPSTVAEKQCGAEGIMPC